VRQRKSVTHVELDEEEGEERLWDGERRREDDAEVAKVHLGRVGVLRDQAQVREAASKEPSQS